MSRIQTFGNYFTIYINEGNAGVMADYIRTPYGQLVNYPLVDLAPDEIVILPFDIEDAIARTVADTPGSGKLTTEEINLRIADTLQTQFAQLIKSYDMHLGMRGGVLFCPGMFKTTNLLGKGTGGWTHYPPATYSAVYQEDNSAFACICPHQPIFYKREASVVPPETAISMPDCITKFLFVGDGHLVANGKDVFGPAMLKIESTNPTLQTVTECAILKIWE